MLLKPENHSSDKWQTIDECTSALTSQSPIHSSHWNKQTVVVCRQLFKLVILPGRSEKDPWGAQLVRVGCAPANWRHCCKVLQEMGSSVVLPPCRHPVCGIHPGSGRRGGWSIIVQQDPSRRSGA